jgi:hypothetical protein
LINGIKSNFALLIGNCLFDQLNIFNSFNVFCCIVLVVACFLYSKQKNLHFSSFFRKNKNARNTNNKIKAAKLRLPLRVQGCTEIERLKQNLQKSMDHSYEVSQQLQKIRQHYSRVTGQVPVPDNPSARNPQMGSAPERHKTEPQDIGTGGEPLNSHYGESFLRVNPAVDTGKLETKSGWPRSCTPDFVCVQQRIRT